MTDRTQMTAEGRALYSLWLTGSDYDTLDPKIAAAIAALEARASLDRDALYRRIHAIPSLPHHGKGEQCFPITDAVLAALSREEPTQPTINEYGRAMCACGVSVLPENWPNHLLSQQRGPHRAALKEPTP